MSLPQASTQTSFSQKQLQTNLHDSPDIVEDASCTIPTGYDMFTSQAFKHTFCDSLQSISTGHAISGKRFPKKEQNELSTSASQGMKKETTGVNFIPKKKRKMVRCDIFHHLESIREYCSPPPPSKLSQERYDHRIDSKSVTSLIVPRPQPEYSGDNERQQQEKESKISIQNSSHTQMLAYLDAYCQNRGIAKFPRQPSNKTSLRNSQIGVQNVSSHFLPTQLGGKSNHVHAKYHDHSYTHTFEVGHDSYNGPVSMIGKGVYGYAVKCNKEIVSQELPTNTSSPRMGNTKPTNHPMTGNSVPVIMKIDHNHKHLTWEVLLHIKVTAYE
jgi:hypothetical protein